MGQKSKGVQARQHTTLWAQDHNILILFVTFKVARSEGAQDIFENIPAWQPVDQGGWRKPLFEMCCIHMGIAQILV